MEVACAGCGKQAKVGWKDDNDQQWYCQACWNENADAVGSDLDDLAIQESYELHASHAAFQEECDNMEGGWLEVDSYDLVFSLDMTLRPRIPANEVEVDYESLIFRVSADQIVSNPDRVPKKKEPAKVAKPAQADSPSPLAKIAPSESALPDFSLEASPKHAEKRPAAAPRKRAEELSPARDKAKRLKEKEKKDKKERVEPPREEKPKARDEKKDRRDDRLRDSEKKHKRERRDSPDDRRRRERDAREKPRKLGASPVDLTAQRRRELKERRSRTPEGFVDVSSPTKVAKRPRDDGSRRRSSPPATPSPTSVGKARNSLTPGGDYERPRTRDRSYSDDTPPSRRNRSPQDRPRNPLGTPVARNSLSASPRSETRSYDLTSPAKSSMSSLRSVTPRNSLSLETRSSPSGSSPASNRSSPREREDRSPDAKVARVAPPRRERVGAHPAGARLALMSLQGLGRNKRSASP